MVKIKKIKKIKLQSYSNQIGFTYPSSNTFDGKFLIQIEDKLNEIIDHLNKTNEKKRG